MIYGRAALRQYREQEQAAEKQPVCGGDFLSQIPPDAPMDDATLTVWNGERWVAWDKWVATAPLIVEEMPQSETEAASRQEAVPAADSRPRGFNEQIGLW